jgi:hypothetical protein
MSDEIVKASKFGEIGQTGLKGALPIEGWLWEEFLPELRGLEGARRYQEMQDNDPMIGALLFAIEMLVKNVKWRVDIRDKAKAEDAEAMKLRDWYDDALLHDLKGGWHQVVAEALSALTYGYHLGEVVYKRRDSDGLIGVQKIAPRSQHTVWRWLFDDTGDVTGFEQFLYNAANVVIPMTKLLHWKNRSTRGNPEGRSLLRNAYVTYKRKNRIEEAEGRSALRGAGLVVLRIPGEYLSPTASPDQKRVADFYRAAADKLAQDKQGSLVIPSDVHPESKQPLVTVEYVTTGDRKPADLSPIVDRQDKRIVSVALADFIVLGQDGTGSLALSSNKTTLFARAGGAVLKMIREPINEVLIPRLAKLNDFDPELLPTLEHEDIEQPDIEAFSNAIKNLAGAGMPLFPSEDGSVESHIREVLQLPDVKAKELPMTPALPGAPGQLPASAKILNPQQVNTTANQQARQMIAADKAKQQAKAKAVKKGDGDEA